MQNPKHTSEIATLIGQQRPAAEPQTASLSGRDKDLINECFRKLQTIFPAWRQAFDSQEALEEGRRQFVMALAEAGVTSRAQIAAGMRKARQAPGDFWPSPGKFIGWCVPDPADFGLPSQDEAFRQACRQYPDALHPAVAAARQRCEPFSWLRMTEDKARQVWAYHYGVIVRQVMAGEPLDQSVADALPPPPQQTPAEVLAASLGIDISKPRYIPPNKRPA